MKKSIDKIIEAIENHNKIILLRHINPDGDAYGVQLGLKELIKLNWPDKFVKASGKSSKYLNYIGKMDEVSDEDFKDSLVIIGDCGNLKLVDDQRFNLAKTIIKIDHHPNVEPYGDLDALWVDTEFVAASEMIAYWAKNNNLKIDCKVARIIFHGIITDSGRFLFKRTNERTFELASYLLKTGFDLPQLYSQLYQVTENNLKFNSYVYQNYKTNKNIIYITLDKKTLNSLNILATQASPKVNLLANVEDKYIWIFFCELENGNIRVEFRSSKYSVNQIARKYNGGGHQLAAGAIINSWDLVDKIVNDCQKLISLE